MGIRDICFCIVLFLLTLIPHAFAQNGCSIDFLAAQNFAAGTKPVVVITADWNEDGYLDLATANLVGPGISVLFGTTGGSFQPPVSLLTSSNFILSVAASDWNEDGHADLVAA